jgi:hypothetical protein
MFCNAIQGILGLQEGASWEDVRRTLSDDQIRRIHGVFSTLWPEDTDLAMLLPRPNAKRLRSVYIGIADPRTVDATVLGWLPYIDEILLVNPFFLGARMKPEFSPIDSPAGHKMQTLKNVLLLLKLEPFIRAGLVHLVPDPSEVNAPLGQHVREVLTHRTAGWKPPKGGLHSLLKLGGGRIPSVHLDAARGFTAALHRQAHAGGRRRNDESGHRLLQAPGRGRPVHIATTAPCGRRRSSVPNL